MTEHDLQVAYTTWLSVQYPLVFNVAYAIPNGGKRHVTVAYKLKREGAKAGIPDYCLPIPNHKYHSLYIEFKVGKNKTTDLQKKKIDALRNLGHAVHVVYNIDEAMDITKEYLSTATLTQISRTPL